MTRAQYKSKVTYKRSPGSFTGIPHAVGQCANYGKLSRDAKALLLDLCMQLKTHINGTLVITLKAQREYGWLSNALLYRARDELLHYGFIVLTHQGGLGIGPSYYALTFFNVQQTGLDIPAGTEAPDDYKLEAPVFNGRPPPRKPPQKNNIAIPVTGTGAPPNVPTTGIGEPPTSQSPGRSSPVFDPLCPDHREPSINHLPDEVAGGVLGGKGS